MSGDRIIILSIVIPIGIWFIVKCCRMVRAANKNWDEVIKDLKNNDDETF